MNPFNLSDNLDRESARHRLLYLAGIISVLGILAVTLIVLFLTSATRIQIEPDDARSTAKLTLGNGLGAYIQGVLYSLSREPKIIITADGFITKTQTIPAKSLGKQHTIILQERPGSLQVTTRPEDSQTLWKLNGTAEFLGQNFEKELEPGHYTLVVDNKFFLEERRDITIRRDQQTRLSIDLTAAEGLLNIRSTPEKADVFLNDERIGQTPLRHHVIGGDYKIIVEHPEFVPSEEKITLTRNQNRIERHYRLAAQQGSLTVFVSPSGGLLMLNGLQVKPGTKLFVDALKNNRLSYHKDGFAPKDINFSVNAQEDKEITLSLNSESGLVNFFSNPTADVLLNGKKIGHTPFQTSLPAVTHKISFIRDGYFPHKTKVKPSPDSEQTVRATLQSRKTETVREYVNSAGVSLKLFEPNGSHFQMGASRSEKGQRANEFTREVKLQRPFYAGVYEITNEQFGQFRSNHNGKGKDPVTAVTWNDAALFCNWLSQKEGLTPFYGTKNGIAVSFDAKADGYRLLSEAEWEWLARQAKKKQRTRFTWGDQTIIPPQTTNIADENARGTTLHYVPRYNDGYKGIAPVGQFNREPSGLFDMAGNVSEWVHDYYSLVPPSGKVLETDPLGSPTGGTHTRKGASWLSGTLTELRASYRDGPAGAQNDIGFRIGRYADEE